MRPCRIGLLLSVLLFAGVPHVQAQTPGYQTITSTNGYQFQVPNEWQPDSSDAPQARSFSSPGLDAHVLMMDLPATLYGDPLSVLQTFEQNFSQQQRDWQATDIRPTSLPGASVASVYLASYTDVQAGASVNRYNEAVLTGDTIAVLLVVDSAAYDQQHPEVATAILRSFQPVMGPVPDAAPDERGPNTASRLSSLRVMYVDCDRMLERRKSLDPRLLPAGRAWFRS